MEHAHDNLKTNGWRRGWTSHAQAEGLGVWGEKSTRTLSGVSGCGMWCVPWTGVHSYISGVRLHPSACVLATLLLLLACTHDLQLAPRPPRAAATTTTGPWASMIFVARTDSGVLAIDLGWTGADDGLRRVLNQIGATPSDVRWVFLTHAHRDHIGGWSAVRQATFVLGRDEVPYFTGTAGYRGFVPRIGDRLFAYRRPKAGELKIVPVSTDTMFTLGQDTLRAYPIPGHTAGSTGYLFRETLFAGDAANWRVTSGFRGARSEFSDDVARSRASMVSLVNRLDTAGIAWRVLCTAHGKCGLADSTTRLKILR